MQQLAQWQEALEAAAGGATLLTAGDRLAQRALGEDALRHRAAGRPVWRRPDILSWGAWLRRLYADALAGGLPGARQGALLSPIQAESLWQRIIEADGEQADQAASDQLMQPAAAARLAAEARALCLAWRLDYRRLAVGGAVEEVSAFVRWSRAWEAHLAQADWLEPDALPDRAAGWLEALPSLRPQGLWLAGFTEFTPQQSALLAAAERCGIPVRWVASPEIGPRTAVRVACRDPEQELTAVAAWTRAHLARNPQGTIGIVVHDLAARRDALVRELEKALDPPARRQVSAPLERPWNLSLGRALAGEPLVHAALLLLQAGQGQLDFILASRLLRSPFIGGAEAERAQRLRIELALRERGETRVATALLASHCRGREDAICEDLAGRLEHLLRRTGQGTRRRLPGAWLGEFVDLLAIMGWPGERSLNSEERQTLEAWHEAIAEFGALDAVLGPMERSEALGRLRRHVAARLFQARSPAAPVQVLGMLEAVGQSFDALWITGLHDEVWPPAPRPNPFLPIRLQREAGLPRATADRELAFSEGLTAGLLAAASEVVASWPARSGDQALRPSPLILHLPEQPALADDECSPGEAGAQFEYLLEPAAPLVAAEQPYRGGTAVLRDQSQCPFRAFATHRLGANPLESPRSGLDPRERGQLVHELLEKLWDRLRTHAELAALPAAAREALVLELVETGVHAAARRRPTVFRPRFVELEIRRLRALLLEWLEKELARSDFRVCGREQLIRIRIGRLQLRGRIDRMDELADGRLVLIDYKTGKVSWQDWLGERPRDPQLPLYALYCAAEPAGVLVARLSSRQCSWIGLARDAGLAPGIHPSSATRGGPGLTWDQLVQGWREVADRLAGAFLGGHAAVDPLPRACEFCHLAALCRIDELRGSFARDSGAVDGDEDGAD